MVCYKHQQITIDIGNNAPINVKPQDEEGGGGGGGEAGLPTGN